MSVPARSRAYAADRARRREAERRHPAKYTAAIAQLFERLLLAYVPPPAVVLDPFAGTGKLLDRLAVLGYEPRGIELEPDWVCSRFVVRGNALTLPYVFGTIDAVVTSPTYGNRMADKDMRESVAGTYAKGLGRIASEGSSCHMQWGDEYRAFHEAHLAEVDRVLVDRGVYVLNMKNHYRRKEEQDVVGWWWDACDRLGWRRVVSVFVDTPGNRHGQNSELRADGEWVGVWMKERSGAATLPRLEGRPE